MAKNPVKTTPIVYVTRDIERALGMAPNTDYRIITNRTPYSEMIKKQYPDYVFLVDPGTDQRTKATETINRHDLLDTSQLLETTELEKIMASAPHAAILVFKNTTLIESICKKKGWTLLNPSAELAEKIENKLTQIEWLGELGQKYLPPHTIAPTKDLIWKKEPMVIQWAHGHTGDGTILINYAAELAELATKFKDRLARATAFVKGPSFTMNILVIPKDVYTGNISYQITGLPPFTENPFSTVGNDWSLPHTLLGDKEIDYVSDMAREVGKKLAGEGWVGMCGIDVIKDDERDAIYLIEINARQPASTSFESKLQQNNRSNGVLGSTIFEAYISTISGAEANQGKVIGQIIPVNDGAQIIQRITKTYTGIDSIKSDIIGSLTLAGYDVIPYMNTVYNSDLLRIQSSRGIMESHGKLNTRGREIADIL